MSWRPLFAREGLVRSCPPAGTVILAARGGRAAPRSAARAEAASEAAVWKNAPPPLSPLSMLRSPGCAASWGAGWRRWPTVTSRGRERPTRRCWACRSRWAVSHRGRSTRRPRARRGAAGLARTWRCGTTSSTRAWLPGQPSSAAAAGGRSMGARAFQAREARRWSSGCSRRSTKTSGDGGRRAIPASHSSTRRCGSCSRRATVRIACGKTPPRSSRRTCALTGGLAPSGSSGC
mmetsp:Transcript_46595/g.151373  ORF Transcript_46595/g.151373 Transcript_46595/m.151373 type:complete len:234 (+) Transcript_46595:884-1585(+)